MIRLLLPIFLLPLTLLAQRDLTDTGADLSSGAATPDDEVQTVRVTITERMLTHDREWTTADGRKVTGALLAHRPEDGTAQEKITVIKDETIRMKVGQGTYELELKTLSEQDRDYIRKLALALEGPKTTKPTRSFHPGPARLRRRVGRRPQCLFGHELGGHGAAVAAEAARSGVRNYFTCA